MKISIITASYNYAQFIEEAINSVISQSYQNWELIIVDDGSCDNSLDIIKSYCKKDSRIKLFQHKSGQNKGLKQTLLLGIKHAKGEWIAFLESDDYFEPDNLLKKIEVINKYPEVKLIFNKVKFISEKKCRQQKRYESIQKKLSTMNFPRNMFYDFYINNMILTFSCVMVKTDTIKNENFDTPTDSMLDWWLWIHLAFKNNFYYIDEELTFWRLHDTSYIKTGKKPIFYPTQVQAYKNIYKTNGKSLNLLLFMIVSNIKLFFVRGYRFLHKEVRVI